MCFRLDAIMENEGHLQDAKNRRADLLRQIDEEDKLIRKYSTTLAYLNSISKEKLEPDDPYFTGAYLDIPKIGMGHGGRVIAWSYDKQRAEAYAKHPLIVAQYGPLVTQEQNGNWETQSESYQKVFVVVRPVVCLEGE